MSRGGARGKYPRKKTKPKVELNNPTWLRVQIEKELSDKMTNYCHQNKLYKSELVQTLIDDFFKIN